MQHKGDEKMKVIDITERLNFAEKPKIIIKDTEITVNNSATTILKIMPKVSKKSIDPGDVLDIIDMLVPEEEMKKLDKLCLSFEDFMTFIEAAISLVTGADDAGEALTRTTT